MKSRIKLSPVGICLCIGIIASLCTYYFGICSKENGSVGSIKNGIEISIQHNQQTSKMLAIIFEE